MNAPPRYVRVGLTTIACTDAENGVAGNVVSIAPVAGESAAKYGFGWLSTRVNFPPTSSLEPSAVIASASTSGARVSPKRTDAWKVDTGRPVVRSIAAMFWAGTLIFPSGD